MKSAMICGLAVMTLCMVLFSLPAGASTVTLQVFGNANMDDIIDDLDIEYIQGIVAGKNEVTDLADANLDGRIDVDDITLINSIINEEATNLTLRDSGGNIVKISLPVERIILYHHQCGEVIQILGAQDNVVGVRDTFKDQARRFPEISTKPSIGSGYDPDIEAVLSLDPDLILAYSSYQFPEPKLLDAKLPDDVAVLRMDCECNDGVDVVKESVVTLGYLLGKRENTEKYLEWHNKNIDEIAERISQVPKDERLRFFLESSGTETLTRTAIGKGHAAHQICVLAGGDNIAAVNLSLQSNNEVKYGSVETEWVLEQNPEVIVGRAMGEGIRPYEIDEASILAAYADEIRALPGFAEVDAVANDRIYIIANDYAISPNYPTAVALLAKWFYPDLFGDIDPAAIHQEYMDLMGISFNVSEHGAFFYPGLS